MTYNTVFLPYFNYSLSTCGWLSEHRNITEEDNRDYTFKIVHCSHRAQYNRSISQICTHVTFLNFTTKMVLTF